jgi:hypothetical protein
MGRGHHLTSAKVIFLILASANLLVVWLIGASAMSETDSSIAGSPWSPSLKAIRPAIDKAKSIESFSEVLAHPIFFKSREPYVPPPPPKPQSPTVSAAPPVDPGLSLAGIVLERGTGKAYLINKASSQGVWLQSGEDILGWKLRTVTAGSVSLEQGGRVIELQLYPPK